MASRDFEALERRHQLSTSADREERQVGELKRFSSRILYQERL
jgi:hypothetical protein